MCLGLPMRVVTIDGVNAECEAQGIQRTVSLFMMQKHSVEVGDFVIVHVGYAIQKIDPVEAQSRWELIENVYQTQ